MYGPEYGYKTSVSSLMVDHLKKKIINLNSFKIFKNKAKILAAKKKRYYENKEKFLKIAKEYRSRPNVKKKIHSYLKEFLKKESQLKRDCQS